MEIVDGRQPTFDFYDDVETVELSEEPESSDVVVETQNSLQLELPRIGEPPTYTPRYPIQLNPETTSLLIRFI